MNSNRCIGTLVMLLMLGQFMKSQTRRDGEHDFDFEIGVWKTHLSRLQHPLTGSTSWVEYNGTSVVRKVGRRGANLVEFDVAGSAWTHRSFVPASVQCRIPSVESQFCQ